MLAWMAQTCHGCFPVRLSPSAFGRRARHLAGRMVALMRALALPLRVGAGWPKSRR